MSLATIYRGDAVCANKHPQQFSGSHTHPRQPACSTLRPAGMETMDVRVQRTLVIPAPPAQPTEEVPFTVRLLLRRAQPHHRRAHRPRTHVAQRLRERPRAASSATSCSRPGRRPPTSRASYFQSFIDFGELLRLHEEEEEELEPAVGDEDYVLLPNVASDS
jgi:hypothetical protein